MDIQHGHEHGQAAWTCAWRHEPAAWIHGHAGWKAAWTYSMYMQHGHTAWACSTGHEHAALTWTGINGHDTRYGHGYDAWS